MKRLFVGLLLGLTAIVAFMPMPGLGQTPATTQYTPPRTPEGQPDLQGVWQVLSTAAWDLEGSTPFLSVPAGHGVVEGGLIPNRPAALAKKKENYAKRATLDPETKCLLPGIPRMTYMPYPFQIVQQADKVTILYEYRRFVRRIHLDGLPHPEGHIDFWLGDSRGRWEGNSLVVDIIHFNDKTWFDRAGNFHSDALHVVERYTPTSPYHILYEATIEDPQVFTRPWKISMPLYRRVGPEAELLEYQCAAYVLDSEWDNPASTYFQPR